MTDEGVRIIGLDRLVKTLRTAQVDLSDLKRAHGRTGELIAREAAARGPKRSGDLVGTLRASKQARRAQVLLGRNSVPYAGPIHWGWPSRGIAANPFVSEAAQASESRWLPLYLADVQAAVDKVRGA